MSKCAWDKHSMGLATDHAEWKPVLDALESEGIPASAATIQQEHRWDQQAVRYATREGNPFSLLEDDEQDAIRDILEGL